MTSGSSSVMSSQNQPSSLFDVVSRNLRALGALSLDEFHHGSVAETDLAEISYRIPEVASTSPVNPSQSQDSSRSSLGTESQEELAEKSMSNYAVARLHETCQRVFGNANALKFEFLEENGPLSKQCVLTISRPNGSIRSYRTEPSFKRKSEAKTQAAAIAVDMGAIDFIITGDSDSLKVKKGLLVSAQNDSDDIRQQFDDNSAGSIVDEIEMSCVRWRGSRVKPEWFALTDSKSSKQKHCAALRIKLTTHSFRVYSSDSTFDSPAEAKAICAKISVDEGVLDFIKQGNAETESTSEPLTQLSGQLTLQSFYESLPQPFSEPFGDKTAVEINAPAWLNTMLQAARGGGLSASFVWFTQSDLALHGCLLRIARSGECKSYIVDPHFAKRAEAKGAVCFQAMSQGLGDYIRMVGADVEKKVTIEMRKLANERIFPMVASEYSKIRHGAHPEYVYEQERDAFGCTMKLDLSPTPDHRDIREYTVLMEYRTKADARVAVGCLAAQQGVIELLRFRGNPPPNYIPYLANQANTALNEQRSGTKRKEPEDTSDITLPVSKKRKQDGEGRRTGKGGPTALPAVHVLPNRPPDLWKQGGESGPVGNGFGIAVPPVHALPSRPSDLPAKNKGAKRKSRSGGRADGPAQSHSSMSQISGPVPGPSTPAITARPPAGRVGYGGGGQYQFTPQPAPETYGRVAYIPQSGSNSVQPDALPYPSGSNGVYPQYPQQATYPFGQSVPPYTNGHMPMNFAGPSANNHPARGNPVSQLPAIIPKYVTTQRQRPEISAHSHHASKRPRDQVVSRKGKECEHSDGPSQSLETEDAPHPNKKRKKSQAVADPPHPTEPNTEVQLSPAPPASNPRPPEPPGHSGVQHPPPKPSVSKSHVTALLDYCKHQSKPLPKFYQDAAVEPGGATKHKVWVEMGKERLELPGTFSTVREGQERVAKKILDRLRSQAKA